MSVDPDAPWVVNVLLLLLVAAIPTAMSVLLTRRTDRHLSGIHTQVTNEHTKNLRDEITEGFAAVAERQDRSDELTAQRFDASDERADGVAQRVTNMGRRLNRHIDGGGQGA